MVVNVAIADILLLYLKFLYSKAVHQGKWQYFLNTCLFVCLFILAVLDLCCCLWVFPRCDEQGLLFVVVCSLLIAAASLVQHGL